MKKTLILILVGIILLVGCKGKNLSGNKNDSIIEEQKDDNKDINEDQDAEDKEAEEQKSEDEQILYYMSKLKDKSFVSTYGDKDEPSIWYTAAEELGMIGKAAIPYLINNLNTDDSYEKGLTLYALLLASQDTELMKLTSNEYIDAGLTFSQQEQEEYTRNALAWWEKYKSLF